MSHLFYANMSTSTEVVTKVKRGRNTRSWGVQCRATVTGGKPERRGGTIFHTRLQKPERPRRLSQTYRERERGRKSGEIPNFLNV